MSANRFGDVDGRVERQLKQNCTEPSGSKVTYWLTFVLFRWTARYAANWTQFPLPAPKAVRLMAIERARETVCPPPVTASYGSCRTAIYKWLRTAERPGGGAQGLRSRRGIGRPCSRGRTTGVPLAESQGPAALWIGFRSLDANGGGRTGQAEIRHPLGSNRYGGVLARLGLSPQSSAHSSALASAASTTDP